MKYLEELDCGECFEYNDIIFILTHDFKKNGDKLCIRLDTGFGQWIKPDSMIKITDIFTMDKDNNIIAIRERIKDDISHKT